MQQGGFIHSKFDTTSFDIAHGFGDIKGNRSSFGAGHQTARAEFFTKAANFAHDIGGRNGDIKASPVGLDLFDEVIQADKIRACSFRFSYFLTLREHQHLDFSAGSSGQHSDTTHHLVGMARINAKPHVNFEGRIELHVVYFLEE